MIVLDFIFFSLYTLVPDKAVLGKRHGACGLFSNFSTFFLLVPFLVCVKAFQFEVNFLFKVNLLLILILLFVGLYILARVIFLRSKKLMSMYRRFGNIPKWVLKTIGILYILFCFVSFVSCGIIMILME